MLGHSTSDIVSYSITLSKITNQHTHKSNDQILSCKIKPQVQRASVLACDGGVDGMDELPSYVTYNSTPYAESNPISEQEQHVAPLTPEQEAALKKHERFKQRVR